jgi:hypothetical protein
MRIGRDNGRVNGTGADLAAELAVEIAAELGMCPFGLKRNLLKKVNRHAQKRTRFFGRGK